MSDIVVLSPNQRAVYDSYAEKASKIIAVLSQVNDINNLKSKITMAVKELSAIKERRLELSRPIKDFADNTLAQPEKELERAINFAKNTLAKEDERLKILETFNRNRANLIGKVLAEIREYFFSQLKTKTLDNIDEYKGLILNIKPKYSEAKYKEDVTLLPFIIIHNEWAEMAADYIARKPFADFQTLLLDEGAELKKEWAKAIDAHKALLSTASKEVISQTSEVLTAQIAEIKTEIATPVFADTIKYDRHGKIESIDAFLKLLSWYISKNYTQTSCFEDVKAKLAATWIKEGFAEFEGFKITKTIAK